MAVAGGRLCCSRPSPICFSMGRSADSHLVLCRYEADTIFCRLGDRFGPRLRSACPPLYTVGVGGLRTVRLPAQPTLALRGLFLRRCGSRGMRYRARLVWTARRTGTALGRVADCGGGVLVSLDGAHGADNGRRRLDLARIANSRRSQLCSGLLRQLLCNAGARTAVRAKKATGVGYAQA